MKDYLSRGQGEVIELHTAVVGSGAAGYNAALRLKKYGVDSVGIFTEKREAGTSRNAGSDKQTYYKLSLCGNGPDSPGAMARDLFAGGCVDGDVAYAEAALSVPCFLQLAELGVPFPVNRLGEYVGYRTDHDATARATSAGPLTSRMMTERLEEAALAAGVTIYDRHRVVKILRIGNRAVGLIVLRMDGDGAGPVLVPVRCRNVIYAVGGPAGIYADTVYPADQWGASGTAFEAGAWGRNLTEWQYGLASVSPRWNVSGTYMQVLPRFVSIGEDGGEHEFLAEHYGGESDYLSLVFRKGYEWPFDCRKAGTGSSVIDLLVYRESVLRKRRVYLDFRSNPQKAEELPYDRLDGEAYRYLSEAEACFGTPVERLCHMNRPAYELYLSKGVDLRRDMLEIALCAQHNNGGLDVDCWWQTNVRHLFAAGEAAGSHGVYRPGGSALNAGQVGGMRAAQYIAFHEEEEEPVSEEAFWKTAALEMEKQTAFCAAVTSGGDTLRFYERLVRRNMSAFGGAIRSREEISRIRKEHEDILKRFEELVRIPGTETLADAYRLKDILIAQQMYLAAMEDYASRVGASRGSAIYSDPFGEAPAGLEERFRFSLEGGGYNTRVQLARYEDGGVKTWWRDVRPLPEEREAFETVWRRFRRNRCVD